MSIITFTNRNKELIHRFLDLHYDESIQPKTREELTMEYEENDGNYIIAEMRINKILKANLQRDITFHDDACGRGYNDNGCRCRLRCDIDIKIMLNDNTIYHKTIFTRTEDQKEEQNISIEQVKEMISGITDFKICQCGTLAIKDSWCKSCYLYRYTRTEEEGGDCSICMENEGRWIKTECGHFFHTHCFKKLKGDPWEKKCPLCRSNTVYRYDPFDE